MQALFHPSSTVVIGVSDRRTNMAREIVANLLKFEFKGMIHLVGREGGVLFGHKIHASLEEIDEPIDVAIVLTPAKTVPEILEQCGKKGITRVIIESGGFGEFGDQGEALGERLKEIADTYGIRFIGPNCIGIINPLNGLATPFVPLQDVFRRGNTGIIAQSGGVALSLLFMFGSEHMGFSKFATVGNKLNINENDLLEYYIDDPDTSVICMYLESIRDGRTMAELAKRSSKPILVHKSNIGALSREIAHSHTEAITNDDEVVSAAFKQAGIVRFRDFLTHLDFVRILQAPRMRGRNLAIVSRSGGHAVIAADAAQTYGFNLPPFPAEFLDEVRRHLRANVIKLGNPLDLGDLFDFDVYVRIVENTIRQETIDGILFLHTYFAGLEGAASRRLLHSVAKMSKQYDKPIAICVSADQKEMSRFHEDLNFPTFVSPERAVDALDRSIKWAERRAFLDAQNETVEPAPNTRSDEIRRRIETCRRDGRSPLLHEALDIISAAGVPTPEHCVVTDPLRLHEEIALMPGPYAAKVISSDVSHKFDKGGVALRLHDREAARDACASMLRTFGEAGAGGFQGALIQRMVPRGPATYEMIIGGKRDKHFGPMVLLGHGGVFVEVFGKSALRMVPVSRDEIDEMIDELPGSEIFRGVRGLPEIDREALIEAVFCVGRLMAEFTEIDSLDVNPIIVSRDGAQAVDARIFLTDEE